MENEKKDPENHLIHVGLYLNSETWEIFKNHVKAKYGRFRGVLGHEVDTALKNHVGGFSLGSLAHTHTSKIDRFIELVKSTDRTEFTDKELIAILTAKFGLGDTRTHRNYLKALVINGHATCRAGMSNMIYSIKR